MYSQGETFYYEIDGDEYELTVVDTFITDGCEYIIAEDFDEKLHFFYYDEDEEEIYHVDDTYDEERILKEWASENYDGDMSSFDDDDDDYYDEHDDDDDEYEGFHEIDEEDF